MGSRTCILVWLNPKVKVLVEKIADSMGVSQSEYVRRLIIADLDKRSVFTTRLKEAMSRDD